jgi:hypothetical protein
MPEGGLSNRCNEPQSIAGVSVPGSLAQLQLAIEVAALAQTDFPGGTFSSACPMPHPSEARINAYFERARKRMPGKPLRMPGMRAVGWRSSRPWLWP